jgi:sulfate adenylyltransferase subunit 1
VDIFKDFEYVKMDLLRFITAGSVDDGKSTLIGRLLYDSKSILADQLEAIERSTKNKEAGVVDLALLTDGLRAEREQGITIDVAYRYFNTEKRKFIIADAPGHVQYTRNMITGASNADAIILLIDARQGVLEQTRRHSIIASLLKVQHVIVAVNKMDLVGFDKAVFDAIRRDFQNVSEQLGLEAVHFVPISARVGDNIVNKSESMLWYQGKALLTLLEELPLVEEEQAALPRFQVQYVIRPQTPDLHDYRGFAGKVSSGVYQKGDRVVILPAQVETTISSIELAGEEVEFATAQQGIVLHLEDDIDVSRGDYIIPVKDIPTVSNEAEVLLCWMDEKQLVAGNKYLLRQGSRLIKVVVKSVEYRVDVNTLERLTVDGPVKLNEVVKVRLKSAAPMVYDSFEKLKSNGSGILVDETSNATAAGIIFQ